MIAELIAGAVARLQSSVIAAVVLVVAGGGALLGFGAWQHAAGEAAGRAAVQAEWDEAKRVAAEAKRQAETALATAAARTALVHQSEIAKLKAQAQEEIDAYKDELAKRPRDARCVLSRDDVRRLRGIGRRRRAPSP